MTWTAGSHGIASLRRIGGVRFARDLVTGRAVTHRLLCVANRIGMLPDVIVVGRLKMMVRGGLVLRRSLKVRGILPAVIGRGLPMFLAHGTTLCRGDGGATCFAPLTTPVSMMSASTRRGRRAVAASAAAQASSPPVCAAKGARYCP